MYRLIDFRWEGVYGVLVFCAILFSFSAKYFLLPGAGTAALSIVFFLPGLIFLGMYILVIKLAKRSNSEIPAYRDQAVVVTIVGASILLSDYGEWVLFSGMLAVFIFITHRLWSKPEMFWRIWFFRAAREYFREVEGYTSRPGNRSQGKVLPPRS